MAKKVVKTTDQVINTLNALVKKLISESQKDDKVSLILFCGKKADIWNQRYMNTSANSLYGAVMELCQTMHCDKDELETIAKILVTAVDRKRPMEVVKEDEKVVDTQE